MVLVMLLTANCAFAKRINGSNGGHVKNVIVMIPDGCSQSIQTLARWYVGGKLNLDSMVAGTVSTYMSDSVITDSAAAAAAFATGYKTSDGFLSIAPRPDTLLSTLPMPKDLEPYEPVATVLELAKLLVKSTGLVATSRITHATPAAYASHFWTRNDDNEIMEQMVYEDIDVVFGGGWRHLVPPPVGNRTDGEDLKDVLFDRGYQWVETRDQMMALTSGKVWGLFAKSHMEADIDRAEFGASQPSLAEMTAKAIELLSEDPQGFFLVVEGSQVDWAGHANDPIYMLTDFLAFDDAVGVTMAFAKDDGETLVLAFPDHNTGALSLGNGTTPIPYTATKVEDLIGPLQGMRITSTGLVRKIGGDKSPENVKHNILEWWGIDASEEEITEILALHGCGLSLDYAISKIISRNHTVFGWTTHGHTGEDVPLWAYGPHRPVGLYDNTELATLIAQVMGGRLSAASERLFVEVGGRLNPYEIDTTDPTNPVLVLKRYNAKLPISKDLLYIGDQIYELEGTVVYPAPDRTGKVYVPRQVLSYLK